MVNKLKNDIHEIKIDNKNNNKNNRRNIRKNKIAPERKILIRKNVMSMLFHLVSSIFGAFFFGAGILMLIWGSANIHPGIEEGDVIAGGNKLNIPEKISVFAQNAKYEALSNYLADNQVRKKIYKIENGAVAPKPHDECYGCVEAKDAYLVNDVIDKARDIGLLEGQDVAFSSDAVFYKNCKIKYYLDETILAILWREEVEGKIVTFAEVKIADASQFGRKLVNDSYGTGRQMFCSDLSKQANAVVGLNADYYAFRSLGVTCYDGTIYRTEDSLDTLFIDEKGDFIFFDRKQKKSKEELQQFVDDNNIKFGLSFGPIMVKDGVSVVNGGYPIGQIEEIYSRAGIGQMDQLHYLFVNIENYGEYRRPCPVKDYAPIMIEKGIKQGYNLDGGQTSEVVFQGDFYNFVDYGNERDVSDIIFFASALPEDEETECSLDN